MSSRQEKEQRERRGRHAGQDSNTGQLCHGTTASLHGPPTQPVELCSTLALVLLSEDARGLGTYRKISDISDFTLFPWFPAGDVAFGLHDINSQFVMWCTFLLDTYRRSDFTAEWAAIFAYLFFYANKVVGPFTISPSVDARWCKTLSLYVKQEKHLTPFSAADPHHSLV